MYNNCRGYYSTRKLVLNISDKGERRGKVSNNFLRVAGGKEIRDSDQM